jgi:phenylpropionate dioxygenase-like ring-hydroxylating dioxygenase large terminal subunit
VDKNRQLALLERISANEAARTTDMAGDGYRNPVSKYLDVEQFQRELTLLQRVPLVACLSCEVKEPGDYCVVRILERSVLIVRGDDGAVRAFHNVCSHRGSTLVQGCGHKDAVFRCPYHAWQYRLDGTLKSVPTAGGFEGLALERDGALATIECVEVAGIIFVRLEGSGPVDGESWISGMADELREFDLASYHPLETRVTQHTMNWKLMQDTFLESYHIPFLHRATFHPILRQDAVWDAWGPHSRNVGPRRDISELADQGPDEWDLPSHAVIGYNIFPNVNLTYGSDHFVLFRIFPAGIDSCYAEVTWYAPNKPTSQPEWDHWRRTIEFAYRVTEDEDFATQELIQQNLRSGALKALVAGRNEPALVHYHRSLDRMILELCENVDLSVGAGASL